MSAIPRPRRRLGSSSPAVAARLVVVLVAVLAVMPASATAQSDLSPPHTSITDAPSNPTSERTATFAFTGTDDTTPPDELEFECRLDTSDENLWVECLSPQFFQGLLAGQHTFEVHSLDAEENIDPTPARYTWTVLPPATTSPANTRR